MDRVLKTIELSDCKVEVVTKLNWGEKRQLEACFYNSMSASANKSDQDEVKADFKGDGIMAAKYKLLEICIKKITNKDGQEITYSDDWASNLDGDDGDLLYAELEELNKKK